MLQDRRESLRGEEGNRNGRLVCAIEANKDNRMAQTYTQKFTHWACHIGNTELSACH